LIIFYRKNNICRWILPIFNLNLQLGWFVLMVIGFGSILSTAKTFKNLVWVSACVKILCVFERIILPKGGFNYFFQNVLQKKVTGNITERSPFSAIFIKFRRKIAFFLNTNVSIIFSRIKVCNLIKIANFFSYDNFGENISKP
jgi:hypothetical protein